MYNSFDKTTFLSSWVFISQKKVALHRKWRKERKSPLKTREWQKYEPFPLAQRLKGSYIFLVWSNSWAMRQSWIHSIFDCVVVLFAIERKTRTSILNYSVKCSCVEIIPFVHGQWQVDIFNQLLSYSIRNFYHKFKVCFINVRMWTNFERDSSLAGGKCAQTRTI